MWWRLPRAQFIKQKGASNKRAFRALVRSGECPGILAYAGGTPVGWCAVAAREATPALERSRILKRVDEKPVWSVTCFFIATPFRRRGVSVALLRAAAGHVARRGGRLIEGYPVETRRGRAPDAFVWTGLAAAFREAGFGEVARRSATRPIMRLAVARTTRVSNG